MAKIALYETEDPGDRKCKDICHDPKCHVRSKKADKWKVVHWGNNVTSAWLFVWPWKRNTPWCNQVLCHDWIRINRRTGMFCNICFKSSDDVQTSKAQAAVKMDLHHIVWYFHEYCHLPRRVAGDEAAMSKTGILASQKYRSWLISPKYTVSPPAEFCQSMTKRGRSRQC